jgi:hypothetical protein
MLLISAFLSEISATSASGFFMDHAESMGSGRQQWTSGILELLEPHARVPNRLAESVARMCKVMSIKRVAEHYHLHWGTVKDIHKGYLERTLEPASPGKGAGEMGLEVKDVE